MSTQLDVKEIEEIDISNSSKLVVHNDDVNSFDHVIHCFVSILGHTFEQAEQCALIIHTKGKCSVKEGSFDDLMPYYNSLIDMKLRAKIE